MILYAQLAAQWLQQSIVERKNKGAVVAMLADHNTAQLCLPVFDQLVPDILHQLVIFTIPAGEAAKNLHHLSQIWEYLTYEGAGRDALLICLGGGMVTDIGGLAASTYKRGIDVVHVPTTLLAMVDAAIGGKTGIDYQHYKNHVGTFYQPLKILIFSDFLKTLPKRQILAGFAEVVKYALIHARPIPSMPQIVNIDEWLELIQQSAQDKITITSEDFTETGLRKILNFGHTIGHAIEALALEKNIDLLHGEAVAAGMLAELWLSAAINHMPQWRLDEYAQCYALYYNKLPFSVADIPELMIRMRHDKKNSGSSIRFVLINNQLKAEWDIAVDEKSIIQSLEFLLTFAPTQ